MESFVYRCPNTRQNVQGIIADAPGDKADDGFQAIVCNACARLHWVNPKTGRVLGASDK